MGTLCRLLQGGKVIGVVVAVQEVVQCCNLRSHSNHQVRHQAWLKLPITHPNGVS